MIRFRLIPVMSLVVALAGMWACGPGVAEGFLPTAETKDSSSGDTKASEKEIDDEANDGANDEAGDDIATDTAEDAPQTDGDQDDGSSYPSESSDTSDERVDTETEPDPINTDIGEGNLDKALPSDTAEYEDTDNALSEDCSLTPFIRDLIISADTVVQDGEFVSVGMDCVLLKKEEEGQIRTTVAFLSPPMWDQEIEVGRAELVSTLTPLSISCYRDPVSDDMTATVLMKGDLGVELYEADYSGEFSPMAGAESLRDKELTQIALMIRSSGNGFNRLCAFGRGLYCRPFDGDPTDTWVEELAPQPDYQLNDVGLMKHGEDWSLLMAGGKGHIHIRIDGDWQEVQTGTDVDLYTISGLEDFFIAGGQSGVFVYGSPSEVRAEEVFEGDVVALNFWGGSMFKGTSRNGEVFEGQVVDEEVYFCPTQQVPGPLITSLFFPCSDLENFVLLREDALIGAYECRIIILI